jgi:hypothetical protein
MKTKIFYFIPFLILLACEPLAPSGGIFLPPQKDVAILRNAKYISHSATELIIETEIVVLKSYYRGIDYASLDQKDFQFKGDGIYAIKSFDAVSVSAPAKSSSTILLIDQSGDYLEIDPHNTRSQVINKFLQDIALPDKFLAGASAENGKLSREPADFFTGEFGNEWLPYSLYIYELSKRTGGTGAMPEATVEALEKLGDDPAQARKELVLLVHSDAEGSAIMAEDLITKARLANVAVNVIILGDKPDKDFFFQLSMETGGLFAVCPGILEINKVFSELERLINHEKIVYRFRVSYKPTTPEALHAGTMTRHTLEITEPNSENSYSPLTVNIKIPS